MKQSLVQILVVVANIQISSAHIWQLVKKIQLFLFKKILSNRSKRKNKRGSVSDAPPCSHWVLQDDIRGDAA